MAAGILCTALLTFNTVAFQPASRQTPEFWLAGKGLIKEKGCALLYLSSPVRPGNLRFTEIIQAGKGTKGKGEALSAI